MMIRRTNSLIKVKISKLSHESFSKDKIHFYSLKTKKKADSATWVSVDLMHKSLLKIQSLITNQRFLLDPVPPGPFSPQNNSKIQERDNCPFIQNNLKIWSNSENKNSHDQRKVKGMIGNLYLRRPWAWTSAWYLALQVSRGYKIVVLTIAPMAPEVASDIDSRSTDIFLFFSLSNNYTNYNEKFYIHHITNIKIQLLYKLVKNWSFNKHGKF